MKPVAALPKPPPTVHRPDAIADRIVDAILAGRIGAGQHLGEQALADLFGVSRTLVREALGRLSARGMVEVNARRGWTWCSRRWPRRATPSAPAGHRDRPRAVAGRPLPATRSTR
jgi:DNA-binding FadR family transcriptional regulator